MKLFILLIVLISGLLIWFNCFGEEIGIASWYSTKESKGVMANGEKLDDERFTCASWDFSFGDILVVQNLKNNRKIYVEVTDRGPGRPKCSCIRKKNSRTIDLSKRAFSEIADLKSGLISVSVERH